MKETHLSFSVPKIEARYSAIIQAYDRTFEFQVSNYLILITYCAFVINFYEVDLDLKQLRVEHELNELIDCWGLAIIFMLLEFV